MKKLIVNGKEIEFFIDYLRVGNKANHDYSNEFFDYNCNLNIVSRTKLSEYEKEIVARYIKNPTINNLIKLKKEQLLILETDLKDTGDDGFGRKQRRIDNMKEDLRRIENDAKEHITARNK